MSPITNLTDVNRNVWVLWSRRDGELDDHVSPRATAERIDNTNRMPLPRRDFGNLEEQPLACSVLEARLHHTKLHSTCKDRVLMVKKKANSQPNEPLG